MKLNTNRDYIGKEGRSRVIRDGLTLLAVVTVLMLTLFFLHQPLLVITIGFYLFLGYCLLTDSKTGIIFLALSYPLVRNSFAAITGNFLPALFYAVFLTGLLLVVYGNILGTKVKLPSLMMDKYLLVLTAYIGFSLFFLSPERSYGMEKLKYLLMNIILFYLPVLLVKKERDLEQAFKAVLCFGLFFTVYGLISFLDMEPFFGNELAGRFTALGMNPIWMARYFSYAILVQLYYIIKFLPQWDKHIGKILILGLLIFFQLFLTMLTGSRGPLVAMLFALFCVALLHFGSNLKLGYIIALAGAVFLVMAAVISLVPAYIAERLLVQEIGGQSTTVIRIILNLEALYMFSQNLLRGVGFGGYSVAYFSYPHNIVTEVMAELGIVGLILLTVIFILAVKYLLYIKNRLKRINYLFLITLLLASFVNASLSGHIGSNFFFFFSLSLIYAARQAVAGK